MLIFIDALESSKVTKISETNGFQLQVIQYVFHIETLFKGTLSFQKQDWLKRERDREVE